MTRTKMPDLKTSKRHAEALCRRLVFHRATNYEIAGGVALCERCGLSRATDWAHIIPRRYSVTRCEPDNAWALCRVTCHQVVDQDPVEKVKLIERTIGMSRYGALNEAAQAGLNAVGVSPRAFWFRVRTDLIEQCEAIGLSTKWKG